MIMYPARKNTQLSVLCKMFIYMFFSSLLIVFLHDGVIKTMYDEELQTSEENNMMSGIDVVNADAVYNSNPMSTLVQQPVTSISAPISAPAPPAPAPATGPPAAAWRCAGCARG